MKNLLVIIVAGVSLWIVGTAQGVTGGRACLPGFPILRCNAFGSCYCSNYDDFGQLVGTPGTPDSPPVPLAEIGPLEVPAAGFSGARVLFTVFTTEIGSSISCDPPGGSVFPIGTTTVTCTIVDATGATNVQTFTV